MEGIVSKNIVVYITFCFQLGAYNFIWAMSWFSFVTTTEKHAVLRHLLGVPANSMPIKEPPICNANTL